MSGAFVKFLGTIVRWVTTGFKVPFKELWNGPQEFEHALDYGCATQIIGLIALVVLGFFLSKC